MKLDPGMHIGMHLVFFGKAGVTWISWTGGGLLLLDAAAAACVSRPHGRDHSAPLFGTTGDRGVAAAVPW
jgi:hypothetical protein